jgi:hypothetical protein
MTLLEMYSNTVTMDKDALIDECLEELKGRVVELNREQLESGLNVTGGRFRQYRNRKYAGMKARMNPKPGYGNPDLKLTGDFWRAFRAEVKGGLEVYSTDPKADDLESRYEGIYGLTADNLNELRADFLILFNEKLKVKIGLQ